VNDKQGTLRRPLFILKSPCLAEQAQINVLLRADRCILKNARIQVEIGILLLAPRGNTITGNGEKTLVVNPPDIAAAVWRSTLSSKVLSRGFCTQPFLVQPTCALLSPCKARPVFPSTHARTT